MTSKCLGLTIKQAQKSGDETNVLHGAILTLHDATQHPQTPSTNCFLSLRLYLVLLTLVCDQCVLSLLVLYGSFSPLHYGPKVIHIDL